MENNKTAKDKQTSQNKYHTVPIRMDLPKIAKFYREESLLNSPPNDFWIEKLDLLNVHRKMSSPKQNSATYVPSQRYGVQYSITNGPYTATCSSHPLLTAFLRAYNSHEDVILSPDDLWLMICIYFSKYINQNAKQRLLVNDPKTQLLTVEEEKTTNLNWEDFVEQISLEITRHVNNDLCSLLTNDFSTTTNVESLLSSLTMMSTLKKCFDYTYTITSCGIRSVHFLGTLNDWILLREKTNQLRLFTEENDDFLVYINGVLPIVDQFIQTYQGNVDKHFWDTIFDLKHEKDESDQADGMYINGWFLRLCYENHTKQACFMTYIELQTLIVPVQVENEHTNMSKTCYLVGGFHGVMSHDEKHKPVLSMAILDDTSSITALEP